ncbi:MAG: FHA domain-containing protein [Pirellulaceae bacterium]
MSLTRAFLEIVNGPEKGRRILLRPDQVRYVGRTDQADDSCPANMEMSSVHFSVRLNGNHCEVKDLNSANGTLFNGKRIEAAVLRNKEEFKAGRATFRLVVEDGSENHDGEGTGTAIEEEPASSVADQSPAGAAAASPSPASLASGLAIASAAAVCQVAPLDDASKAMLVQDMPVAQFVQLLASRELFLDAVRVVAYSATKRSAVDWACRCIRLAAVDEISPADKEAMAAAEAWVADPAEDRRRQAGSAAELTKHETPAGWAAMAAFWSGGSMGPPTAPVVPPGPTLTAHAASGAVMLAAVARQPEKMADKYHEFLRLASEVMANGSGRASK